MAGSALALLLQRGVEYLYSALLCDWEALQPGQSPCPDPALVGPALYAMDLHGEQFWYTTKSLPISIHTPCTTIHLAMQVQGACHTLSLCAST